jgi:outer membrane receptor protein involved in Fe transport
MTVTGSRIVQPNLESVSPVTAISSDDLAASGKVRVEDIINQLPQAFAAQGSSISNASDGTASVNLRGLGSVRTLVLVNGRRLMPGDPDGGSAADLNFIPSALVRRVEVLTGGASSVYGADAVAGVVNFIMDDQFEGVKAEINLSYNQHNNDNPISEVVEAAGFPLPEDDVDTGYSRDYTFALGMGAPEDKGHATFYATYRSVASVLQANYDYSACTLGSGEPYLPVTDTSAGCAGSGTTFPGQFAAVDPNTNNLTPSVTIGPDGSLQPFGADDLYNFGPLNYYQRPDERYTAGVFANYQVSDYADVYGEFMWMDDRSVSQIAPSGAFFGNSFTLSCQNPFFTDEMRQTWCDDLGIDSSDPTATTAILPGRRNVEGGGRQDDIGHEASRTVVGVRGNMTDTWSYDVSGVHGETKRNSTYLNDFSISRLGKALNAVEDADGNIVCAVNADADTTNDDLACVPYNIWQPGGVTPQALAYLQIPLMIRAQAIENIMNGNVTADLTETIQLPTADAGLQVNFGAEYRHEETEFQPDLSFQTGDGAGQGAATLPVAGQFHVTELFTEVALPLVDGKKGVEQLAFEGGYRYSDYSTGFDTDTWKLGLSYKPVDSLRLRGSFQHAVRAPNVGELFSLQQVALDGTTDPCAGPDPEPTQEECARTGMTAAQYGNVLANPANQYNGLIGGNPDLQPETADTTSFGFVFQPNFLQGLTVAIDYFDIQIDDTIGGVGADLAINTCVATGDPFFCDLINRDQFGSLWLNNSGFIVDTNLNTGTLSTKGFDIQAGYGFDVGSVGRLGFNLVGTYLSELVNQPLPGADSYDCAGFYGATCSGVTGFGGPSPEWRHSFRVDWAAPWQNLDVGVTWRYFDGVDADYTSADIVGAGNVASIPTDDHLGSRSYIDLTAAVTFADRYTVRVGANNLMDKDPPLNGGSSCPTGPCNGNTWPGVYDTLGRQLFLNFTSNF